MPICLSIRSSVYLQDMIFIIKALTIEVKGSTLLVPNLLLGMILSHFSLVGILIIHFQDVYFNITLQWPVSGKFPYQNFVHMFPLNPP